MNPFNFPSNRGLRMQYTADVCPRTLELLRRTVIMSMDPDWTAEQITEKIDACRKAGKRVALATVNR